MRLRSIQEKEAALTSLNNDLTASKSQLTDLKNQVESLEDQAEIACSRETVLKEQHIREVQLIQEEHAKEIR